VVIWTGPQHSGIIWKVVVPLVASPLAGFVIGFAVMAVIYVLAINVGIGMCYHRLLTHRGYQVPKWLEYLMAVCATLSLRQVIRRA